MRRSLGWPAAFCLASTFMFSAEARAQGTPRGFWSVADGDAVHNNWQKAETQITAETVAKDFKFLWKLKLGNQTAASFSETLLVPGMITGKGFKDFAFLGDAHTLYAVDSELGTLVWQKDFESPSGSPQACGGTNIQIATEAPQVIHFGARRPPGTPAAPPPAEEPVPASARRIGASAGGGTYGLKGIYALTSDGYIHEQILATGLDYAPPVKFFSEPGGSSFGLNMNNKTVYAPSGTGCKSIANAIWSIDLNTPDYTVSSYKAQKLSLAGLTGPAIGSDGTAYVVTGSGPADPAAGVYPNSVVALASGLKVKDWYTPSAGAKGKTLNASPVVFTYKDRELIAAPGKDGGIVLLDSKSLGGPDHHTPLADSWVMSKPPKPGAWESLATWQDKAGVPWVMAAIAGPVAKFAGSNGPAPHGSIVAFMVEEKDGHIGLTPVWISRDLMNPAPPVIANGIVFALDGGSPSSHATLYALDAATGKQLFSSGDTIATYTHLAGMSVGDGHVFLTTHDNTLYSFGIPLEH